MRLPGPRAPAERATVLRRARDGPAGKPGCHASGARVCPPLVYLWPPFHRPESLLTAVPSGLGLGADVAPRAFSGLPCGTEMAAHTAAAEYPPGATIPVRRGIRCDCGVTKRYD